MLQTLKNNTYRWCTVILQKVKTPDGDETP